MTGTLIFFKIISDHDLHYEYELHDENDQYEDVNNKEHALEEARVANQNRNTPNQRTIRNDFYGKCKTNEIKPRFRLKTYNHRRMIKPGRILLYINRDYKAELRHSTKIADATDTWYLLVSQDMLYHIILSPTTKNIRF